MTDETLIPENSSQIGSPAGSGSTYVSGLAQASTKKLIENYRITPAALYSKIDPNWIPKGFLLQASLKVAQTILKPNGRLIISWPPRHGKPLAGHELVLLENGTYKRLDEIVVGDRVITHKGRGRKVTAVHEQGELEAIQITTTCGRDITAALDHPFLTNRFAENQGWVDAGDLKVKDQVYTPRDIQKNIKPSSNKILTPSEARLLGYMIGDGSCTTGQLPRIACFDPVLDLSIVKHAKIAFEEPTLYSDREDDTKKSNHRTWGLKGSTDFFKEMGIYGQNSHTKRVPEICFMQSPEIIAHICGAYFDADGCVNGHKRRKSVTFTYCSCNLLLLQDIQRLLLRLGIRSVLDSRWKDGGFNAYKGGSMEHKLEITRRMEVEKFDLLIPLEGRKDQQKEDKLEEVYGSQGCNYNLQKKSDRPEYIDDDIKALELVGKVECRCLTVEEDETFLVNDIVVHNSRLATIATPIWLLENFPHLDIILATYGADLSTEFGREVRDIMEKNRHILNTRIRPDVKSVGHFKTTKGGSMLSVGLGGAITGKGADAFIIDDYIKTADEAGSRSVRDKHWEWFTGTAYHRLEPNASMIIIATRWHKDDLIGRIKKEFGVLSPTNPGGWDIVEFRAIAEEDDPLGRPIGEPLFPERYGLTELADRKRTLGTFFFNAIFQQKPEDDASKLTDPDWIDQISHNELPVLEKLEYARIWDFGGGKSKENDPSVGALIGVDHGTFQCYIIDIWRGKVTPNTVESVVRSKAMADGTSTTVIIEQEPGASGKQLVSHLTNNVLPEYNVMPSPATHSKVTRAMPFLAACESGKVKILDRKWMQGFLDEFADFPDGQHDDQVDAVAIGYNMMLNKKPHSVVWGRKVPELPAEDNNLVSGASWGSTTNKRVKQYGETSSSVPIFSVGKET